MPLAFFSSMVLINSAICAPAVPRGAGSAGAPRGICICRANAIRPASRVCPRANRLYALARGPLCGRWRRARGLFQINAAGLFLQHGFDEFRDMRARRAPRSGLRGGPGAFASAGQMRFARHQGFARGQTACTRWRAARCAGGGGGRGGYFKSMPLAFFSSMVLMSSAICAPASTAVVPWRWMLETTVRLDSGMRMWAP